MFPWATARLVVLGQQGRLSDVDAIEIDEALLVLNLYQLDRLLRSVHALGQAAGLPLRLHKPGQAVFHLAPGYQNRLLILQRFLLQLGLLADERC